MFTRPFSIWRRLKPINILATFTPYGSCECGNSFFGRQGKEGRYSISYHSGRIICYDCYKARIREIKRHDHAINAEPRLRRMLGAGVWEYGSCTNPFCFWHYKDSRFKWVQYDKDGWWTLTDEFYKHNDSTIPIH